MGCLSKKGQYPSTGPPTYQIIIVPNANHMNVMKTSLTIIPMCPRERFPSYKSLSRLVLCYKKDWATLLHFIYFCYLLLVTNYLIIKLSVTYYFSACREYLAEYRLSFPSAPRWVRHSYLSKEATIDPLYLWVIKTFFWRRCRGVIVCGEYSRVCLFALSLSNFYLLFLVVLYL